MHIPINKDLEEAYKNEFMKGFTLREISCLAVSVLLIGGVTVLVWRLSGLAPDVCIYMGLPFGLPTLLIGFKKIQGLTLDAYVKEIIYEKRTKVLTYDADELPEYHRVFTMERLKNKRQRGLIK